jgi:hypothetical protein
MSAGLPISATARGRRLARRPRIVTPRALRGSWGALIWLGIGVAIVAWLTATHAERMRAFGSILGEGDAIDERRAAELDPP